MNSDAPTPDEAAAPCQKCQVYPDGTVYRTRCICPEPMTPEETLRGIAGMGGAIGDAVRDLLAERDGLRTELLTTQQILAHAERQRDEAEARLAAQQPVIDAAEVAVRTSLADPDALYLALDRLCMALDKTRPLSGSVEAADTPPSGTSGHEADTPAEPDEDTLGSLTGHCCPMMRDQSTLDCEQHHDHPIDCPDVLVLHGPQGPGLPIRDGGSSWVAIRYCPWCATDLCAREVASAPAEPDGVTVESAARQFARLLPGDDVVVDVAPDGRSARAYLREVADTPAEPDESACQGCVTPADVGLPEHSAPGRVVHAHPECPVHGAREVADTPAEPERCDCGCTHQHEDTGVIGGDTCILCRYCSGPAREVAGTPAAEQVAYRAAADRVALAGAGAPTEPADDTQETNHG